MRALTAGEKEKLFEGHALFGILGPDDIGALLSLRSRKRAPADSSGKALRLNDPKPLQAIKAQPMAPIC